LNVVSFSVAVIMQIVATSCFASSSWPFPGRDAGPPATEEQLEAVLEAIMLVPVVTGSPSGAPEEAPPGTKTARCCRSPAAGSGSVTLPPRKEERPISEPLIASVPVGRDAAEEVLEGVLTASCSLRGASGAKPPATEEQLEAVLEAIMLVPVVTGSPSGAILEHIVLPSNGCVGSLPGAVLATSITVTGTDSLTNLASLVDGGICPPEPWSPVGNLLDVEVALVVTESSIGSTSFAEEGIAT
jgi:hypothetical protein